MLDDPTTRSLPAPRPLRGPVPVPSRRGDIRQAYDQQRQDKYGRTLAYVYLEDDTFVNAEIIKQGYGFAYTRFPFKYLEEFRQLEREAREAKRGLWGP